MIEQSSLPRAPLLAIHLSSNRPAEFTRFLDRLEEATADKSALEVLVKVDDNDAAMNELASREARVRPFRVAHISTPLIGGFYGLWRCYDDLLKLTHPGAYFVIGLNDEMYFKTKAWDVALRRYVGLFADHIFRLRTSPHRFRNYFDYWEPGFANDTSAIMTKRWLDAGGGWCPCNGPDTFQECVAFYFGWLDRFNADRPYRDLAIADIEFGGHGAALGLTGSAMRRRQSGAIRSHFTLMSHAMQEEAARRAQKLHAYIWAYARGAERVDIRDNVRARAIEVVASADEAVLRAFPYPLSRTRIYLTNAARTANYAFYAGGGSDTEHPWQVNLLIHLGLRYAWLGNILWAGPADSWRTLAKKVLRFIWNAPSRAIRLIKPSKR